MAQPVKMSDKFLLIQSTNPPKDSKQGTPILDKGEVQELENQYRIALAAAQNKAASLDEKMVRAEVEKRLSLQEEKFLSPTDADYFNSVTMRDHNPLVPALERRSIEEVEARNAARKKIISEMVIARRRMVIVDSKGLTRQLMIGPQKLIKGKKGQVAIPPNIEITPKTRQIFRYIVNGNQSLAGITYGDVLGAAGGICTVVNSALRLVATSARIISITLWPVINPAGGNANPAEVAWVGANADQVPDTAYNETLPAGTTVPHAIKTRPPKMSLAADWFNNAVTLADVIFQLTCGQGSVLDLEIEYTQPNSLLSTAITIATGTLGVFYYLTLNHSGSKNIFPSTLPNTT
jgi:hypothetical protein